MSFSEPVNPSPMVELRGVTRSFRRKTGGPFSGARGAKVLAVREVTLSVKAGETVGLVGESGSGKSTVGKMALGLLKPDSGDVLYRGEHLNLMTTADRARMKKSMSAVFQDPNSSLDPRMRVGDSLAEPLRVHGLWGKGGPSKTAEMLSKVGLPASAAKRYPHEFSGGQRQRIAIARALMLGPQVVVCDEPLSSLDPSIQAQVINLLLEQKRDLGLSYLFISHDLAVVRHMSDRIAVMYGGRLVESGPAAVFSDGGLHPYTRLLFGSVPGAGGLRETAVPGVEAVPADGCPFRPRCPRALPECSSMQPHAAEVSPGHAVACMRVAP